MPLGINFESRLVSASVGAAPTLAKVASYASGTGVDKARTVVASVVTRAASVVSPTVRNVVAHVDAENRGFEIWKEAAEKQSLERAAGRARHVPIVGGPFSWILAHGTQIPGGAFECGKDADGSAWYACRTFRRGGLHVGKIGKKSKKGAEFCIEGSEVELEDYEVLVSNGVHLEWVASPSPFSAESYLFEATPVSGGNTNNGTPFFIARGSYWNATHPSTVTEGSRQVAIIFGGRSIPLDHFDVLVPSKKAPPRYEEEPTQ